MAKITFRFDSQEQADEFKIALIRAKMRPQQWFEAHVVDTIHQHRINQVADNAQSVSVRTLQKLPDRPFKAPDLSKPVPKGGNIGVGNKVEAGLDPQKVLHDLNKPEKKLIDSADVEPDPLPRGW